MNLKRTQEEIVARIEARKTKDIFGFEINELIMFLDYQHARPYLKPETLEKEWEQEKKFPRDIILDYLTFAWDKACSCRGISAGRSIQHFISWLWLDGKDALSEWAECEDNYQHYGKEILRRISEEYDFNWRDHDDGLLRNSETEDGKPWPDIEVATMSKT